MKEVVVLFGPTGVGKTKLSIDLAKKINGEIISADSMQIYKKMDIGTAKITKEEMQGIPHYMLDVVDPNQEYSVGEYVKETNKIISDIISRNKIPIIVGGTGLYINALTNNYDFHEAAKDEKIREKYNKIAEEKGKEFVYELLKKEDSKRASEIHQNDLKRIIRALEIIELNKNNKKTIKNEEKNNKKYKFIIFGLNLPREMLYENINKRAKEMFDNGLLEEVNLLIKNGASKNDQAMQAIGYKEIMDEGLTQEEKIEIVQRRSRNYAKRQLTFMRGMKDLIWIENDNSAMNKILGEIQWKK